MQLAVGIGAGELYEEGRELLMPVPWLDRELASPDVNQMCLIERAVHDLHGNLTSAAAVLSVSSLAADQATPAQIATLIRGQPETENGNHYVRDVSYGEDASQISTGAGPASMPALRKLRLEALRHAGITDIAQEQRCAHCDHTTPPRSRSSISKFENAGFVGENCIADCPSGSALRSLCSASCFDRIIRAITDS